MNRTTNICSANIRTGLLATASSIALLGYVFGAGEALAASDDQQPLIWIDLGGQAERTNTTPELFKPPFFKVADPIVLSTLTEAQKFPPYSTGFDGKISFQPEDSSWVFSAAVRYGRSSSMRVLHRQTAGFPTFHYTLVGKYASRHPVRKVFADAPATARETHNILDFKAGKDVGLGLFASHGESIVSAGVRFAQFTASHNATLRARPIYTLGPAKTSPGKYKSAHPDHYFMSNTAILRGERSLRAVGPSLSWAASLPIVGKSSDAELNLDWGINAAVLFGKQRARVHHQTTGYVYHATGGPFALNKHTSQYANPPVDLNRSHTVSVPNIGGFAGITFRYVDAKISFGYRGDFFFNAMDGGIDVRKSKTLGFHGPFASISVGMGG